MTHRSPNGKAITIRRPNKERENSANSRAWKRKRAWADLPKSSLLFFHASHIYLVIRQRGAPGGRIIDKSPVLCCSTCLCGGQPLAKESSPRVRKKVPCRTVLCYLWYGFGQIFPEEGAKSHSSEWTGARFSDVCAPGKWHQAVENRLLKYLATWESLIWLRFQFSRCYVGWFNLNGPPRILPNE